MVVVIGPPSVLLLTALPAGEGGWFPPSDGSGGMAETAPWLLPPSGGDASIPSLVSGVVVGGGSVVATVTCLHRLRHRAVDSPAIFVVAVVVTHPQRP